MEAPQILATVSTALGVGGAAFLATWLKFVHPERKHRKDAQDRQTAVEKDIEKLKADVLENEKRADEQRRAYDSKIMRFEKKFEAKLDQHTEVIRHCVSDESFGAHTQETTKMLTGLTEKVGRVTGAIEAWRDTARNTKG